MHVFVEGGDDASKPIKHYPILSNQNPMVNTGKVFVFIFPISNEEIETVWDRWLFPNHTESKR